MLLPFKKFEIETKLPIDDVIDRISKNIIPKDLSSFTRNPTKKYFGSFNKNIFKIYRVQTNFPNRNVPIIFGRILEDNGIVKVKILMRPTTFSLILTFVFFALFFVFCVVIDYNEIVRLQIQSESTFSGKVFLSNLAFLCVYIVNYLVFQYEVIDTKEFIISVLKK